MKKYEGVSVSEDCCVFPWCPTWTWLLCRSIVAAFFRAYCIAYMLNLFPRKKKNNKKKIGNFGNLAVSVHPNIWSLDGSFDT